MDKLRFIALQCLGIVVFFECLECQNVAEDLDYLSAEYARIPEKQRELLAKSMAFLGVLGSSSTFDFVEDVVMEMGMETDNISEKGGLFEEMKRCSIALDIESSKDVQYPINKCGYDNREKVMAKKCETPCRFLEPLLLARCERIAKVDNLH